MFAEQYPITVTPRGWISGYVNVTHQVLLTMPAVVERFKPRDLADIKRFVRVWSWHTSDDQTQLRPFAIVMIPPDEFMASAVATGGLFLTKAEVWIYLSDRAEQPDQNGFYSWTNFIGDVIQGFVETQLDPTMCRIESIKVDNLRRTDPDIDGTEAGQEASRETLEAFWEARVKIIYNQGI